MWQCPMCESFVYDKKRMKWLTKLKSRFVQVDQLAENWDIKYSATPGWLSQTPE